MTHGKNAVHGGVQMANGTLTLIGALFQEAYICASVGNTSRDYNSRPQGPNFHAELIPVHSPLLRESYLVSYPPLTYMLKFSGFADLTSCLGKKSNAQRQCSAADWESAHPTHAAQDAPGWCSASCLPGRPRHTSHIRVAATQRRSTPDAQRRTAGNA